MQPAGRPPCVHELRQASFIVIVTTGETKSDGKEGITPRERDMLFAHEHVAVYPRRRARCAAARAEGGSPEARYARQSGERFCRPETPLAREGPRQGLRRLWAALGRPNRP
jgi:hypothetical protein